jgi:hypothetical protein
MKWRVACKSVLLEQAPHSQLTRVCAYGAVSAMAWQTGGKSLLLAQRRTHSSLVYVHAAPSMPWHGMAWQTGGKSLFFTSHRTYSLLVYVYAVLSLPWHGKQVVRLCSLLSAALRAVYVVFVLHSSTGGMTVLYFVSCVSYRLP